MVTRPEKYEYCGHRAYIGLDKSGLVDTEPVLHHFGATKKRAVEVYTRFVEASLSDPSQHGYYRATEGRVLGGEEFLDEVRHRVGEHLTVRDSFNRISVDDLLMAAEESSGLSRAELCSRSKNRRTVAVKEAVIVAGRERGISNHELAEALGIDASAVTKRVEAARLRGGEASELKLLRKSLTEH
ncbi:MAG: hypothetical protein WAV47_19275 [Blastocatellia bacterium]